MTTHKLNAKTVTVIGLGSIGLPYARYLVWSGHSVFGYDTDLTRLKQLEGQNIFDLNDIDVPVSLRVGPHSNLQVTFCSELPLTDYYLVCVPTPLDNNTLNTDAVFDAVALALAKNPSACVLVKSTLTIDAVASLLDAYPTSSIVVTPEYLREGETEAQLFKSPRVVIGANTEADFDAAFDLLHSFRPSLKLLVTRLSPIEAAYSKILHNAYLATRVAFFNEVDGVCSLLGLNPKHVIDTVCSDPRIGNKYNTPSFGFGGTCLPKDTQYGASLHSAFLGWPSLLSTVLVSNKTRAKQLVKTIQANFPGKRLNVGVLSFNSSRLSPKVEESATESLVHALFRKGVIRTLTVFSPKGDFSPVPNSLLNFEDLKLAVSLDGLEACDVVLSDWKTSVYPELKNLFTCDLP